MRKLFFLFLLVATLLPTYAVRSFTLNLTPDGAAQLFAFLPDNPSGRAVVVLPGGGYVWLSMDNEGVDWAPFFNSKGIACFVLKYRMPKGDLSIPVGDAEHAMRMVRDSAQQWRINPYDVGIMGSSAGGHLASTLATHSSFEARPDFQILFYPVISMNERETHRGSVEGFLGTHKSDPEMVKLYSNDQQVRRHLTPPAIILMAHNDPVVPPITNGIAYYSAMQRQGVPCALYVYPSGWHGFGSQPSFTYHNQMIADLSTWLDKLPSHKPEQIRVACIGNSITDGFGIYMPEDNGYPAQLQKMLGEKFYVRNYGVSARTMNWQGRFPYMNEQAWRDALAFRPNIVIVKLGTNDANLVNWTKDHRVIKDQLEHDYQQMIDSLTALPTKPQIYLTFPIKIWNNSFGLNDSLLTTDIIPCIKKIAKKNKLPIIDMYKPFSENTDKSLYLSDGVHPNEKGCRKMAELVYDALKK